MYNRETENLGQYDLHITKVSKARGGTVLNCEEGDYLLKSYDGSLRRLEVMHRILEEAQEEGFLVDAPVPDRDGNLSFVDAYGECFSLRKWYMAKECDPKNAADVIRGTIYLGKLTAFLQSVSATYRKEVLVPGHEFGPEVARHNRELKNISNYIRGKRQKNEFEELFRKQFDLYYQQGLKTALLEQEFQTTGQVREGICHRDYTHHNVFLREEDTILVHFDNLGWDSIVCDFSLFLRKVMEKNNWSRVLAEEMIHYFDESVHLTKQEYQQLYLRLLYPVRFLKIANHYANRKKSWVSVRDLDKLRSLRQQEEDRQQFLVFLRSYVVY